MFTVAVKSRSSSPVHLISLKDNKFKIHRSIIWGEIKIIILIHKWFLFLFINFILQWISYNYILFNHVYHYLVNLYHRYLLLKFCRFWFEKKVFDKHLNLVYDREIFPHQSVLKRQKNVIISWSSEYGEWCWSDRRILSSLRYSCCMRSCVDIVLG